MTAPIPADLRDNILADYLAGMTGPQVAARYDVGAATVYRIASGRRANRGRKFPLHLLDAAVDDYLASGDSIRVVAGRHPLSEDTLRTELRTRDLTRPSGATTPSTVKDAAIADFLNGMTIANVSEKHGVARSTISAWLDQDDLGAEDREGESPGVYDFGWVLRGGVKYPAKVIRKGGAFASVRRISWENGSGPGPAVDAAGLIRGLTDADRSAS